MQYEATQDQNNTNEALKWIKLIKMVFLYLEDLHMDEHLKHRLSLAHHYLILSRT